MLSRALADPVGVDVGHHQLRAGTARRDEIAERGGHQAWPPTPVGADDI